MGLTALKEGSVWNTMPCHLHERRAETYFYFDLSRMRATCTSWASRTRRARLRGQRGGGEIAPPSSVDIGCGTSNYSFIWAMGGENQEYKDVAWVPIERVAVSGVLAEFDLAGRVAAVTAREHRAGPCPRRGPGRRGRPDLARIG